MRVGEKLICKKSILPWFKEGDIYEISYINEDHIFVPYGEGDFDYNCFHNKENVEIVYENTYIIEHKIFLISDHFTRESEIRMKKLKKIINNEYIKG